MTTSLALNSCHLLFLLCVLVASSLPKAVSHADPDRGPVKRQVSATPPLVVFQAQDPIIIPTTNGNQSGCVETQLLMDHEFAFSYGKPFIGEEIRFSVLEPGLRSKNLQEITFLLRATSIV